MRLAQDGSYPSGWTQGRITREWAIKPSEVHYHKDPEDGTFVRCLHRGRSAVKSLLFYVVLTAVMFPIEHTVFARVEPFASLSRNVEYGILLVARTVGLKVVGKEWPLTNKNEG